MQATQCRARRPRRSAGGAATARTRRRGPQCKPALRLKRLRKTTTSLRLRPRRPKRLLSPSLLRQRQIIRPFQLTETGADPAAMTASKKRRRRRHRSRKPAQAAEGASMPGNEAGMDDAASDKTMLPANQLPVAPPAAQKAASTQTHSVKTAETGKAAAVNTASGATEVPHKASSQQTRRPRAGSQGAAKKAQKPSDGAGLKQEASIPSAVKAEAASAPAQEKKAEDCGGSKA